MVSQMRVALRSDVAALISAVREVTSWLDLELIVCFPGEPPPPADVHVDSPDEVQAGDADWGRGDRCLQVSLQAGGGRTLMLPDQGSEFADALTRRLRVAGGCVIGVLGAVGGVGASVTAALLARSLARQEEECVVVDLVGSGGLEVLLACEDEPGPRWADLLSDRGPFPPQILLGSLPQWHDVTVLSSDARGMPEASDVNDLLRSLAGHAPVMVLDLPRFGWEAVVEYCTQVIVVSTCDAQAVAGLAVLTRALRTTGMSTSLLVRRTGGSALASASELASWCGLPLFGILPNERTMKSDLNRGLTPGDRSRGALARQAQVLAAALVAPASVAS